MSREFEGKTIFITGAAKGQGRAVALAFAQEGANIIAFDLGARIEYPAYNRSSNEDLEKLKSEVEDAGGKILIYAGDVRKASDVKEAVERGVNEFGGIDILFSNAGIAAYGYSWELTEEQWDALIEVNLKGGFLVSKYVSKAMIPQNSGMIHDVTATYDTYVYNALMKSNNIGMAAAAGLFQSVVGFILVLIANKITAKVDEDNALF